ncbi:sigma-70 family RNA polymerase sigma factor [Clostridium thailandense]|uniref:sigma-70 family RNA polymerase sigma factor n=1 Tax=Clostridium thailandense TaxID=2794346 RepID=UPI00398923FE
MSVDINEMILNAKKGDKIATQKIIEKYTPFAIKTARSIYVKGYDIEDLIAIGQAAVIKAINIYDTEKSSAFTTYVFNTIKTEVYQVLRKNIKEASCCSLHSLNKDGLEFINTLVSDFNIEEDSIKREEKTILRTALKKLNEEEKEIIYWYFYHNKTLKDYGKYKGISYRTAVDRKKKAVEKLKKYLKKLKFF